MKLLHIDSSPKAEKSHSRQLSHYFVETLQQRHPEISVETLDLAESPPPHIDGNYVRAIYHPEQNRTQAMRQSLELSNTLCDQLLSADFVVFGVPMHNWCYPSVFKSYIDHVTRGDRTFHTDEQGSIVGHLTHCKMLFITTRGSDLGPGSPFAHMDALNPALRAAFRFLGVSDMTFVNAQPLQFSNQDAHHQAIARAKQELLDLAHRWALE